MTRVLVFFPHNPFPPRSGAHLRCLQILAGLHDMGAQVTFASSYFTSETSWDDISQADVRTVGSPEIRVHRRSQWDARYLHYLGKYYHLRHKRAPLSSAYHSPPTLQRWFKQLTKSVAPNIIFINYAFWDNLVTPEMRRHARTVMETHDLVTLYQKRFELMERVMPAPPISPNTVNPDFVRQDFFDQLGVDVSRAEYEIYTKYDVTVAITPADAALIQKNSPNTHVVVLPMTFEVSHQSGSYHGAAFFPTGPNPFNVQGYLYFASRVLPQVRCAVPEFKLIVTGGVCEKVEPAPGIELRGFVPDLDSLYATTRFLICPLLGKTGQQVKILEAMAHSIPVLATQAAAEGAPIVHEQNGLIARDADEFAEHAIRLWNDPGLCEALGRAARETIAQNFSPARLQQGLREILQIVEPA